MAAVSGCDSVAAPDLELPGLKLELVVEGLERPVFLTAPPMDSARLFIVQQDGRVRVVRSGTLLDEPFLDLRGVVSAVSDQGRGLLSLAFDPEYAATGELYVSYTDVNNDTRLVRYRSDPTGDRADEEPGIVVLAVEQPIGDHNGGHVAFGPDGFLYVGLGDGGSGETRGNAQDLTSLLGAVLRLDVRGKTAGYSIPADNPFVGAADARAEIWAYGLRNPWRWSFDAVADRLYLPDVGEASWEEVNVVQLPAAGPINFGWSLMEGRHCFEASDCDVSGLELPPLEYSHEEGCGVIGGHVYRGRRSPEVAGYYLYADFCRPWIRGFRYDGAAISRIQEWIVGTEDGGPHIVSFGEDSRGELYIITLGGEVYRLIFGP